jgi:hypothetical protein
VPDGRAVRAAHVVGEDLEARDAVGTRQVGEQQVAVRLVGVRALRPFRHLDQPLVDAAGAVLQAALDQQVAGRVRLQVPLQRVKVEVLAGVAEHEAVHERARPGQPDRR